MNVHIRNAAEKDFPAVTELSRQLGYQVTEPEIKERLRYFSGDQEHDIFVAESANREVIGWIHVSICRLLVEPVQALILGLVVHQDYRSLGIGGMLVRAAEKWALERQYDIINVRSNVVRKDAHRFYHKMGFLTAKTALYLKKPLRSVDIGEDAYLQCSDCTS